MNRRLTGGLAAFAAAGTACVSLAAGLPGSASATPRLHRVTAHAQTANCLWTNQTQPISTRVSELISAMSLDQEVDLLEGHGTNNPYVFYEPAIPELCIPQLGEEDGPNGVGDGLSGVTQLPAGVDLAATFSPSLARRYGTVVGSEEFGKGAAVNLGPTINIDRDPRWGRSFESLTEDPYLDGSLASAEVDGVQSTGELSQVKHYAVYNQETNRNTTADDSIVDERTLEEIYLKAFHTVVDTAAPASVMCSYATINGSYACQDAALEANTLKQDWGFPGFITSDYGALHDQSGILDGTDQEQPEDTYFGGLAAAVTTGVVPRAVINTSISRILTEMFRFNLFTAPPTGNVNSTVTSPAHTQIAEKVAEAGTTLLKNTGGTLPLSAGGSGTVAVIGPAADASPTYGGDGSARVVPSDPVSPLTGLESAARHGTRLTYTAGLPTDASLPAVPATALSPAYPTAGTPFGGTYSGTLTAPETGTYVLAITNSCGCYTSTYLTLNGNQILDNPGTPPNDVYSVAVQLTAGTTYAIGISGASSAFTWAPPSALAPQIADAVAAAKAASTAVVVVSDDTETEAADRLSLDLPSAQDELIAAVAAANPRTVVVIAAGAPVAMPWLSQVSSVLDTWYPGEVDGTALASTLFGRSDPSGHLPVTFPTDLGQVPASTLAQFPGTGGQVQYSEGLDVGYRWYDQKGLTPLFPFGFGLSYTTFGYSNLRITKTPYGAAGDVTVSARVTNTGTRAGADVAQLYLDDPAAAGEAPRQLAGYQRVSLAAGQSQVVSFAVTPQSESWWDTSAPGGGGWTSSPGSYGVSVGDSSATAQLPLQGSFTLPRTPGARAVSVDAPATMSPGVPSTVTVGLSAAGTQTLDHVRLALQLPQGWTAQPLGRVKFTDVAPGEALSAQFQVVPAADSPNLNATIHATAKLGPDLSRESGATVTVQ